MKYIKIKDCNVYGLCDNDMIIDLIEIIMDVRYIISFVLCFENEFNILFWNIYMDWGICLKY